MFLESMFSLKGKTALVTGAASGIGQAIAIGLAKAGADVVITGNRTSLDETLGLIEQEGKKAFPLMIDLGKSDQIHEKMQELLADRAIDILVNNAGTIRRDKASEYSSENWREVMAVNLDAVFHLTQIVARPMLERQAGKIISIASLLSFQGGLFVPAYAASKHAVAGLTKSFANEWAKHNVQVNAIAPGYIETKNTEAIREDPERAQSILSRIPAERWGQPDDLTGAAIFLASPASDYVSGHTLVVDGGWMGR
ncbi:2-dehydro-3-deoxy-D-gluconate 5-dehydrogenase KduD [Falsibacillus albus]|uniref:2-dehydro-3-deoxy-D-gluconate 5-dehydrogenase KduD n=1 Tax=Falsibacillus albus TaxID=2478915 RepID=A0A3L7JTT4_9BACI|nr:2-dehydro-3-deoxy-D-gluconate 5-dehydrogenase KduD [Falsibacillus albus]RLQ94287.1 2-dehydro-3-deoxy-D-gluconate 5-dehydrogenase KduD [Falsibacillus albus]